METKISNSGIFNSTLSSDTRRSHRFARTSNDSRSRSQSQRSNSESTPKFYVKNAYKIPVPVNMPEQEENRGVIKKLRHKLI